MAVSSLQLLQAPQPQPPAVPPPGPFQEEGLARSLPLETRGGGRPGSDCFTTGEESAELRGSSRWGSARGAYATGKADSCTSSR